MNQEASMPLQLDRFHKPTEKSLPVVSLDLPQGRTDTVLNFKI